MLISIDNYDKSKSWYTCDRCGNKLNAITRKLIQLNNKKRFDLCSHCWKSIENYVEKGDYK